MLAVRALVFASMHGGCHGSSRLSPYLNPMHLYGYIDGIRRGIGFSGSTVVHTTGQVRGAHNANIQSRRWSFRDDYGEGKRRKGRTATTKDRNRITKQYNSRDTKHNGSYLSNSSTQRHSYPSPLHEESQVAEARLERDSCGREQPINRAQKQSESYWVTKGAKKNNKLKINSEELEYSQAVYGIAPVQNALKSKRREMLELIMQRGLSCKDRKDKDAYSRIQQMAEELRLPVRVAGKDELNILSGNRPHQGFVLRTKPLEFVRLRSLPQPASVTGNSGCRNAVWLALDEITDPQNMGALLRSAYFFGVEGVIVSSKNSAGLTPVTSKASAGALEVMAVHSTSNMMKFLRESRENGWGIIGTALREGSVPLSEISKAEGWRCMSNKEGIIVVLGNEGRGMRTNIIRECDVVVKIPGKGSDSAVDSLNVSVTGALLLYDLLSNPYLSVAQ